MVAPTFSPGLPLSPLGPWKEEQAGVSIPLGSTCSQTLAHKQGPPPARGSAKPFRPPPATCKVQAASWGGMLLGGGDGEQGGKLMSMGSQAVWASMAHSEPSPIAGQQPKALQAWILAARCGFWLLAADFGCWGWSCCKGPCSKQGCSAWSKKGASEKRELMFLPAVQGSPPGQGDHPHLAHQHPPATRHRRE